MLEKAGSGSSPKSAPAQPSSEPEAPGSDTGRESRDRIRAETPELASRFLRFQKDLGIPEGLADILTGSGEMAEFFEAALAAADLGEGRPHSLAPSLANWIVNDLQREMKGRTLDALPVTPEALASLVDLLDGGVISQPVAKEIFAEMAERGTDPRALVRERGLEKVSDAGTLGPLVERALEEYPEKVEAYRGGKTGLMGFFMGQIMRQTQGKADPQVVQRLLEERLEA